MIQPERIDHNGGVVKCPSCKKHKKEVERIEGMGKTWCYDCQLIQIKGDVDLGKEHPRIIEEFKQKYGIE
jgi:hypothetical protein